MNDSARTTSTKRDGAGAPLDAGGLRVRGVTVELGGRRVLDGVDLEVHHGERVVLVGRSGSGKSTLLRVVAGFQSVGAGDVELDGETLVHDGRQVVRPERRSVGLLFQGGGLWPHMNVERTLRFALRSAGVPKPERPGRIAELLEQVELTGYEKRMPSTLSGGEAQRLGLARALSTRPRLLLLDEPLGPLDAELRASLLSMLDGLRHTYGFAALHVTHDPDEARGERTRLVRLVDGKLVEGNPVDGSGPRDDAPASSTER